MLSEKPNAAIQKWPNAVIQKWKEIQILWKTEKLVFDYTLQLTSKEIENILDLKEKKQNKPIQVKSGNDDMTVMINDISLITEK